MYYTDVFVGQTDNNIEKLNNALKAELKVPGLNDLTQLETQLNALASGLGVLAGLPACLCKTKKSVKEGLKKIYEELKTPLISCNLKLNCPSCSNGVPCKCCVIQSIKEVKGSCGCLQPSPKACHCAGQKVSCDRVLAGLEACLHLQCLQSDMDDICQCKASDTCCQNGKCDGKSGGSKVICKFCQNLNAGKSVPTTGLGLSPPNPIRLAQRLDKFFGGKSSFETPCDCSCKGSTSIFSSSCCCLSCGTGKCSKACSPGCLCLKSGPCPRQKFCLAIQNVKVVAHTSQMKCCNQGAKCHCELQSSGSSCTPNCCVSQINSGTSKYNQQSIKCMLRRLVSYFKSLETSSKNFFKSCCDLLCVVKMCHFLGDFYGKRNKDVCWRCKDGSGVKCNASSKGSSKAGQCCSGSSPQCSSGSTCQNCSECQQICYAKEFSRALEELRFAGPCGQNLYRALDDFLHYCILVIASQQSSIEEKLKKLTAKCCKVQNNGSPCSCCSQTSSSSGNCKGCTALLQDPKLKALLLSEFSSAYSEASASWPDCSKPSSSGPCCGSSCPQNCSSGQCPSEGCCEKCPKRLCAKIFLGMLPCLYYGLKILYDRAQDPLTWPGWTHIDLWPNGISRNDLAKFFHAWGYDVRPLKSKKGSEFVSLLDSLFNGSFKSLYDVSKNYIISLSSPSRSPSISSSHLKPSPPKTVRSMLLWLYGLRFQRHFSELVENCKSLCSPFGNLYNSDAFCYYIHTTCFFAPLAIISLIEDSSSTATLLSSSSDWKSFSYPEDLSSLFEKLCEYARKIFVALNFLSIQCQLTSSQVGWRHCYFGKDCSVNSGSGSFSSSSGCQCSGSNIYLCSYVSGSNQNVHDGHCQNGECLSSSTDCSTTKNHNKSKSNCTPLPPPSHAFPHCQLQLPVPGLSLRPF
ncbi:hypothetical protein X943_001935 [Babesia divergens]|uniref:Uncharacterized protein n=1 Tax=Babesia divergens TaxID=32595 RepID=A0AAD9LIC4_BABDI|nr:hypothetical protein X943_001935 [Babesia divergens]